MDLTLLATSVRVPPPPHHLVPRQRLVDALEQGLPNAKVALVPAPAGYGKSTLLADWASQTRLRVCWLSAPEQGVDLERFLRYLAAAWEVSDPTIRTSDVGLLLEPNSPNLDQVLRAFVNFASERSEQVAFVIDDVHLLTDPAIDDALTFLINNMPRHIHFVLAGREAPAIPLARYRARAELLEIGTDDLRFNQGEAGRFLDSRGIELSSEEAASLDVQLEGWAAGLQLLSLTSRPASLLVDATGISGRHRFISDFLQENVLANLDDETRQFLLETSIADRLCASLCNAITGRDNSQAMLEAIERRNLFLAPLDDHRVWFRYHPLLASYLRDALQRESPPLLIELHRRAARWYLERDMPQAAFDHAVASDDLETGTRLFDGYVIMYLESGESRIVERWLESTPPAWFSANPSLGLYQGALKAFQGDLAGFVQTLDEAEAHIAAQNRNDAPLQLAKISVARCAAACFQNNVPLAERYAREALAGLGPEDVTLRANIHHALADSYRRNHRWDEARIQYLRIITTLTSDAAWQVRSAHVYGALADLELMQGRLREAHDLWNKAQAAIEQPRVWGRLPVPIIGWVYIRLAELLYEWDDVDKVLDLLPMGLERAEVGGDVRAMIAGHLVAGRMAMSEGDLERASEHLEQARPLVEQSAFAEWNSRFERLQLELWLAQNRLRAVVEWVDRRRLAGLQPNQPEGDVTQLAISRALIFKGDAPARRDAMDRLESTIATATSEDRKGVLIEGLALHALAQSEEHNTAAALTSFERALRLAEPEGYARVFVDLGPPMVQLLQEARVRKVMADYVDRLLASSGIGTPVVSAYSSMPERLSSRELEILELLAAGLTNREIAEKLFISAETVKKHTSSIYAKLHVGHRTEAVAKARDLNILV